MKYLIVLLLSVSAHADWVPATGIVQYQTPEPVVMPTFDVPQASTTAEPLPQWSQPQPIQPIPDLHLGR